MTGPNANPQDTRPAVTTHPLLGVAGVLLGALIATCAGRLMSVVLADIRGALHLGVDEGSWINTAFNASMRDSSAFNMHSLHTQTGLTAVGLAAEVLGLQVRQQAYTLAISDSFLLLATCCVACLVVVSFMSKVPTQYRQVTAAPVEAK